MPRVFSPGGDVARKSGLLLTAEAAPAPLQLQDWTEPPPTFPAGARGPDYPWGECTWWAARRIAELTGSTAFYLPRARGESPRHANTWVDRYCQTGRCGSTPKAPSVAYIADSKIGHVAVVEAVHADGSFTISEYNFVGVHLPSRRVLRTATRFLYP